MPPKSRTLTPQAQAGKDALIQYESAIKNVRRSVNDEIAVLQGHIKRLQAYDKSLVDVAMDGVPTYRAIRNARKTVLTDAQRAVAVSRYNASNEYQSRYTLDTYLAQATALKVRDEEEAQYSKFRDAVGGRAPAEVFFAALGESAPRPSLSTAGTTVTSSVEVAGESGGDFDTEVAV